MKAFYLLIFNLFILQLAGQELIKSKVYKCPGLKGIPHERINTGIIDKKIEGDTIRLELIMKANCYEFEKSNLKLRHDKRKVFIEHQPDSTEIQIDSLGDTIILETLTIAISEDFCCFNIELEFLWSLKDISIYEFYFHNKHLPYIQTKINKTKPEFEIYHTDIRAFDISRGDTINYFDEYGRKQGRHINIDDSMDYLIYDNQYKNNVLIWNNLYDSTKTLKYKEIRDFSDDGAWRYIYIKK